MALGNHELAQLKGSEKQIAWAEDIRRNTLEHFANTYNRYAEAVAGDSTKSDELAQLEKAYKALHEKEWASWFINCREGNMVELCEIMALVD